MKWRTIVLTLLMTTALSKALSLFHPAALLSTEDGVLRVKIFWIVVAAGVLEFLICAFIYFEKDERKVAAAVCAFSTVILIYRALAQFSGASHCPCLGNVSSWWPWLGKHETPVLTTIAFWLFFTSSIRIFAAESRA